MPGSAREPQGAPGSVMERQVESGSARECQGAPLTAKEPLGVPKSAKEQPFFSRIESLGYFLEVGKFQCLRDHPFKVSALFRGGRGQKL